MEFTLLGSMQEGSEKIKVQCVKKENVHLGEDQACYILITCEKPTADGKMSVEMTYEGDPVLASYLLENAQGFIDQDQEGFSN